jgi:hypothetical protein
MMDGTVNRTGVNRVPAAYAPREIKRPRATRTEMEARWAALYDIIAAMHPMTVRQVFYQATVRGIVEKSEAGYAKVKTDLADMRRAGVLPYAWIADNTRWQRKPDTYDGIHDALAETARFYRKSLWRHAQCYVEIWLEKDALSGVLYPVTAEYDVPLMVARGYASLSFLHGAAENIASVGVPAHVYHLGDFDPSGVDAGRQIEASLRHMAPRAEIHFERLAVLPEQIQAWSLPSRPTKATDSRAKGFGDISVELDAIEPGHLRATVQAAIERHLPTEHLRVLKAAEESERDILLQLVERLQGGDLMEDRP